MFAFARHERLYMAKNRCYRLLRIKGQNETQYIFKFALCMTTIIFLRFCFSASCAESPTKRSITLEVHPSIVRCSPIFSYKLKTYITLTQHGETQLLNLVSFVHCLWPQIFNFGFAFPPVLLNHPPRDQSPQKPIQKYCNPTKFSQTS